MFGAVQRQTQNYNNNNKMANKPWSRKRAWLIWHIPITVCKMRCKKNFIPNENNGI